MTVTVLRHTGARIHDFAPSQGAPGFTCNTSGVCLRTVAQCHSPSCLFYMRTFSIKASTLNSVPRFCSQQFPCTKKLPNFAESFNIAPRRARHRTMASASNMDKDLKSFHDYLKKSKRVLALCGAGLSASSGLPTFRGKTALHKQSRLI